MYKLNQHFIKNQNEMSKHFCQNVSHKLKTVKIQDYKIRLHALCISMLIYVIPENQTNFFEGTSVDRHTKTNPVNSLPHNPHF